MLSQKEVQHIAKLARLGMTNKEVKKFQEELSSILGYIEKLKEVDIIGIKPTSHPLDLENVMRDDRAEKSDVEQTNDLLESVPDTKERYIKVKPIF